MPRRDREIARLETLAWHTENHDRRILVQRAYNYRTRLERETFSKSHIQFPEGHSPLYASYGDGGYIFDVDGNRYVDLVGALYPVILGYGDPDVNEAIRRQLDNGISFSLATELESELSELLCKHIPCAEMVKLGKSGTDVTTAAVRLARAYTGRDHVLVGGYHGWADWSIACTNRHNGIPAEIGGLSHRLDLKIGDVTVSPKVIAAIIVEPNGEPENLAKLRAFCTKHGIVLIFDEIITGFRYDLGGAQKLYGVTPDLACFGKAMANGMPISALVGRHNIMEKMNSPDLFFSGTMFGETLSISAAISTINKIEKEDVIGHITKLGIRLEREILKLIHEYDLSNEIKLNGWYTNQKIEFCTTDRANKNHLRAMFMINMIQNGVLIINSNALSYAHKEPELKRIVTAYHDTLNDIREAIDGSIHNVAPHEGVCVR